MLDSDVLGAKDHSYHIKAIGVAGPLIAGNPNLRGTDELSFLAPAYLRQWAAEIEGFAGFYLYESHCAVRAVPHPASGDQVNVAVAIAETSLRYLPTVSVQPPRRYAFSAQAHHLSFVGH